MMVVLTLSDELYAELLVAVEEHRESAHSWWKHSAPNELKEARAALERATLLEVEVGKT